jgi:chemotaxis protein MotB
LVSFADFMTLMFALFVVLFSSAHHDRNTVQRVSSALKNGFQEMGSFAGGTSDPQKVSSAVPQEGTGPSPTDKDAGTSSGQSSGIDALELQKKLSRALGKEIERQEVNLRLTPEGFVISLHELGFFDSGEAQLAPGAEDKLKKIASVLMQYGLDMRVEGHTDNVPIHNDKFNSNWDLSTARAMAVSMMLVNESGVDPKRMSIAGYAQYHPVASNDTPEGRKANRRVDIVIVSVYHQPAKASE